MKVMKLSKLHWKVVGISKWQFSSSYANIALTAIQRSLVVCCLLISIIATFSFFIFEAKELNEISETFVMSLTHAVMLLWYLLGVWKRQKFEKLFNDLQDMIRLRHCQLEDEYAKTNETIETWSKNSFKIMNKIIVPLYTFPIIASSFLKYYKSGHTKDSFRLVYPAFFPVDWKSPFVYVIVSLEQLMASYCHVNIAIAIMIVYASLCKFFTSFTFDVNAHLKNISNDAEMYEKTATTDRRLKLINSFKETIQFHGDIYQLAQKFSKLFNDHIMSYLLFQVLRTTGVLLEIHLEMKSGYYLNALKAVIIFFAAMPWMFLICYFGDEVRIHFSSINESLQSCAWYAFPLEMQKCIPITMQMAQKAVYVGNFGEIHCTREIFKKINNAAFSYSIILRTFE